MCRELGFTIQDDPRDREICVATLPLG